MHFYGKYNHCLIDFWFITRSCREKQRKRNICANPFRNSTPSLRRQSYLSHVLRREKQVEYRVVGTSHSQPGRRGMQIQMCYTDIGSRVALFTQINELLLKYFLQFCCCLLVLHKNSFSGNATYTFSTTALDQSSHQLFPPNESLFTYWSQTGLSIVLRL